MGWCVILLVEVDIMKTFKQIHQLILCLMTVPLLASRASAVWPPSTALSQEPTATATPMVVATGSLSETSQHAREIVDKLDADERRLQAVLQAIEEDKKKLKEQDNGHSVR